MARKSNYCIEAEVVVPSYQSVIQSQVIKAENKDRAIELYQENLERGGCTCKSISKRPSALPGIIFFSIALLLSTLNFYRPNSYDSMRLYPNVSSLLLSILLYSGFVIRIKGIDSTFKNISDTIITLLTILSLGQILKIFVGAAVPKPGIIGVMTFSLDINNYPLIIAAIVLSWLGVKKVAGYVWIITLILAFAEFATCGDYLGDIIGSVYFLSLFCGFIYYLKYEGKAVRNSLRGDSLKLINTIASDIQESREQVKKTIESNIVDKQNNTKIIDKE